MTVTQSFKIYEVLHKHFKNDADAKIVVQEIEEIIDYKFEKEKSNLSTKEDIYLLRQDLLKFQVEMEKRFYNNILWVIGSGIATVGLIFTLIKLFLNK
jgi:hypothetical protein